jgi:hypothetical protein
MNSNSGVTRKGVSLVFLEVPDTRQCSWFRHYSTSQKDAGCIPDEVPEFFQSVCYWALLFMPLVILHNFLNVFVQLANKRGLKKPNPSSHTMAL